MQTTDLDIWDWVLSKKYHHVVDSWAGCGMQAIPMELELVMSLLIFSSVNHITMTELWLLLRNEKIFTKDFFLLDTREHVGDMGDQSQCGPESEKNEETFPSRTRIDIFILWRSAILTTGHTCKEERNHEKRENLSGKLTLYHVHWLIMHLQGKLLPCNPGIFFFAKFSDKQRRLEQLGLVVKVPNNPSTFDNRMAKLSWNWESDLGWRSFNFPK